MRTSLPALAVACLAAGASAPPAAGQVASPEELEKLVPEPAYAAQDEEDCRELRKEWGRFREEVLQRHAQCLRSQEGAKPGPSCSREPCEPLHVLMQELGGGALGWMEMSQLEACERSVARIQESETRRRRHEADTRERFRRISREFGRREARRRRALAEEERLRGLLSDAQRRALEQKREDLERYARDLENPAERERREANAAAAEVWSLLKSVYKRQPGAVLSILFDSTLENPDYFRTIDENPNAANAVKLRKAIEDRIERENVQFDWMIDDPLDRERRRPSEGPEFEPR